jgi:hypothetical protein
VQFPNIPGTILQKYHILLPPTAAMAGRRGTGPQGRGRVLTAAVGRGRGWAVPRSVGAATAGRGHVGEGHEGRERGDIDRER